MKKLRFLVIFTFQIWNFDAQVKIDTIPFSTETTLLVFNGKINGVETKFAFDTGASLGVLSSSIAQKTGVSAKGSRKINDSNNAKKTMENATIETLQIGSFEIKNVSNVIFDMPFLACNELYLLGANAINQFNWKIDFTRNELYISKTPFEKEKNMLSMDVKFVNNRHFTNLKIGKSTVKNCLIDFGYTGFFEVSEKEKAIVNLKESANTISGSRQNMGLSAMQTNAFTSFKFDELKLDTAMLNGLKVDIRENTKTKIGLEFFAELTHVVILNNTDKTYLLQLKNESISTVIGYDLDYYLRDGKIIVVGLVTNKSSSSLAFQVNEELKSVNGKTAQDFENECEFLRWRMENRHLTELNVEKMNGEKYRIVKQRLE